jgi:hypothetical protein
MRKKKKGISITALLLLLFLCEEVASYLLEKGESYMVEKVYAAADPAAKPPIDLNVPSRTETATFAMG